MRVADIMSTDLVTVPPEALWKHVAERMLDAGVSGLPVTGGDGHLMGIVTEADLIGKPAFGTRPHRALTVLVELVTGETRWAEKATALTAGELMTAPVITAAPEEDVRAAAQRMIDRGVKRLPVVEGGRLVGIVARRDLLRIFDRPDEDIRAELTERLADPELAPELHQVTATVADGVVTLDGRVEEPEDAPVVSGIAWRVPGVVHVVSRVTVREPATA